MRQFTLILVTLTILMIFVRSESHFKQIPLTPKPFSDTIKKQANSEKWNIFWKEFTSAIYSKDKIIISNLTSKDFYDGGGGTVQEWLDSEVFLNIKSFTSFKNMIKKGVKSFKGYEGHPYKATGNNRSGDLFFEYKNNQWLFGGIVGD